VIQLGDLIAPNGIVFDLTATTKADVLERLAVRAAALAGCDAGEVTRVIHDREALGSTGFGVGTAIPHGRLPDLKGIVAVAARLATPVAYAALDGLPVDLVVLMLAPSGAGADHLKALARISRALRDVTFCAMLRAAGSSDAFYDIVAGARRSEAA
jgi:PTS system nitrogen regulatory IIA component